MYKKLTLTKLKTLRDLTSTFSALGDSELAFDQSYDAATYAYNWRIITCRYFKLLLLKADRYAFNKKSFEPYPPKKHST